MKNKQFKLFSILVLFIFVIFPNLRAQNKGKEETIQGAQKDIEKGQYLEAEKKLLWLDDAYHSKADTLSADYVSVLREMGYVYCKKGKYQKSKDLYTKALQIQEKNDTSSLDYANALIGFSDVLINMQSLNGIEQNLQTALSITKTKKGESTSEYAEILYKLGIYYTFAQQKEKAYYALSESATIYSNILGEHHRKYADVMTALGVYYFYLRDIKSSEEYYNKAIEIFQLEENKNHPDYLECLFGKTTLDVTLGRYDEATNSLLEGMKLTKQYYGEDHPHYAGALSNLGSIYFMTGNYRKAEQTLKESLRISNIVFGKGHSYYFNALNMLALLYIKIGANELAEPLLLESLELRKQLYGETNQSVFNAKNSLVDFYITIRNDQKAQKLIDETLVQIKQSNTDNSMVYAHLIGYKARLCEYEKKYEEAVSLYEEAASIYKKEYGEDHPNYLTYLSNVIYTKGLYFKDDNPYYAEREWTEVLSKWEKIVGENHPSYLTHICNLATYYSKNREYEKSKILLAKNIDIVKNVMGENSQLYQTMLWYMAVNNSSLGRVEEGLAYYNQFFGLKRGQIQRFFTFLSEKERELFIQTFDESRDLFYALSLGNEKNNPDISGLFFDCELLSKSLLLNSSRHLQYTINNSSDEALKQNWVNLKVTKNELIKLEEKGSEKHKEVLEEKVNVLEKEVLSQSKQYNDMQQDFSLRWRDIQKALSVNEAAIEIINIKMISQNQDSEIITDTIYSAAILCSDYEYPQIIYLCKEKDLREQMQKSQYNLADIYSLVWKPLVEHLQKKKSLYIAPSGLLHEIPFSSFENSHYNIHNVLSTKDIPQLKKKAFDKKRISPKAVLFGGADYALTDEGLINDSNVDLDISEDAITQLMRHVVDYNTGFKTGQGFTYLPGSRKEVEKIANILNKSGWDVDLYIDKSATETNFKSYSFSSPYLLHISTHGFYYPLVDKRVSQNELNKNPYKISENSLMRSGLAFTGANNIWNQKESKEHIEDGILTAYEVANLDLSNTELVVLSACKTGLGDITNNEGVYGLQRAFRIAGVQSMLVSLWDIPDDATSEFMQQFYSLWCKSDKKTIKQAFSETQNKLKKKHPNSPEKWGGFVLIE